MSCFISPDGIADFLQNKNILTSALKLTCFVKFICNYKYFNGGVI